MGHLDYIVVTHYIMSTHAAPTLFNDLQRQTLAAIVDTIIAPVTDPAQLAAIVEDKASQPHLKDAGVSKEDIEQFLKLKGSSIPGLVQRIESALQRHTPKKSCQELGLLLSVMGSSVGMLALTLSPSLAGPFHTLNPQQREEVIVGLSNSMLGPKRKAFASLKQLICLQAFAPGPRNALWPALGYPSPRSSAEVDRDASQAGRPEKDFTPYLLDFSTVSQSSVTISRGEYDAIIVGSGCGGSVVADRLAQNGFRVLVLEKGPYLTRAQMTGTEADFDQLYENGGIAVTEVRRSTACFFMY